MRTNIKNVKYRLNDGRKKKNKSSTQSSPLVISPIASTSQSPSTSLTTSQVSNLIIVTSTTTPLVATATSPNTPSTPPITHNQEPIFKDEEDTENWIKWAKI